jgi:peptidyl-prolyl cis-trans isomerase B (cyclophilin B)
LKKNLVWKIVLLIAFAIIIVEFTTKTISKTVVPKSVKKVAVSHPKVEILMKGGKTMIVELYPEYAPETVKNFLKLVKAGFYDGLKFHRVMKGFMIQGGDPNGNGTGGADKTIFGEFAANGFTQNTLKHTRGVISMARGEAYDSASSQFFIMHKAAPFLDGSYAAFGKLIQGESTLDAIANTPVIVDPNNSQNVYPKKDVIMQKVFVLNDAKK